jgi:LmbE family N-acetylglucosaminyl deacetylase
MNIVCVGAHPDDCEFFAGGTAVKWTRLGHRVLFVSMTNGDMGHHEMCGVPLAERRAREAALAAERGGVTSRVLNYHDGELLPTLEARKSLIRILREWRPDLVLTHRPNDYHPDHRYTSQLVQDAAFLLTVPRYCPEVPALKKNPFFMYLFDTFTKPAPFHADVAIDITDTLHVKMDMLDAMESQVYEWLPWLDGTLDTVPADMTARMAWLNHYVQPFIKSQTEAGRERLKEWYGPEAAAKITCAEVFEICEYGAPDPPSTEAMRDLFPFFTQ